MSISLDHNLYSAPWQKASIYNLDTISQDALLYTLLSHIKSMKKRCLLQSKQFYTSLEFCAYLDSGGNRCIAGVLLKPLSFLDDKYIGDIIESWPGVVRKHNLSPTHREIISLLQRLLHDPEDNWNENGFNFKKELRNSILREVSRCKISLTEQSLKVLNYFFES
jgi:hypothetical protein